MLVKLTQLHPNPYQTKVRTAGLDGDHVRKIARSMRDNYLSRPDMRGLYQPVLVREDPGEPGAYQVGDGHHRWDAARLLYEGDGTEEFPGDARWADIPVLIEAIAGPDMLLMAVDTALQHKTLSPMDQASAFYALSLDPPDGAGLTQTEIAARYSISQSQVAKYISLRRLPKPVRRLVAEGILTMRHGLALLPLVPVVGVLDEFAARHGRELWSASPNAWGVDCTDTPVAPDSGLHVVTVRSLETNVKQLYRSRTHNMVPEEGFTWPPDWAPVHDDCPRHDSDAFIEWWGSEGWYTDGLVEALPIDGTDLQYCLTHACNGCEYAVLQRGEEHSTCMWDGCFNAKVQMWHAREFYCQAGPVVAWAIESGCPLDRISDAEIEYNETFHGEHSAPGELLDGGHCGVGICDCMQLRFAPPGSTYRIEMYEQGALRRPLPDAAPDFYFVCTSTRRLSNRVKTATEAGSVERDESPGTRRKRMCDELIDAAKRAFVESLPERIDASALAQNPAALRRLYRTMDNRKKIEGAAPDDIWRLILKRVIEFEENYSIWPENVFAAIQDLGGQVSDDLLEQARQLRIEAVMESIASLTSDNYVPTWILKRVARDAPHIIPYLTKNEREEVVSGLQGAIDHYAQLEDRDRDKAIESLRGLLAQLGAEAVPA